MMDTRALQAWLKAHDCDPGPIDGIDGPNTRKAFNEYRMKDGVPSIAKQGLHCIVMHWTANSGRATNTNLQHYNGGVVDRVGNYHIRRLPEVNIDTSDGDYCAHTRAANTGRIGISMAGMIGAQERPFDPGSAPLTEHQYRVFCEKVADLCLTYNIPVTPWTCLTHAEVQPTLGIWQRGKWDITWLPGMSEPGDPVVVGNLIRHDILGMMPK